MTWREKVDSMVKGGCIVSVHYGPYGIGCAVTDPEVTQRINASQKDSEEAAVEEAWAKREELHPDAVD